MIARRFLTRAVAMAPRASGPLRLMHTSRALRVAATSSTITPPPPRPLVTQPTAATSGSSSVLQLVDVPAAGTGLQVNAGVLSHLRLMARYHSWASARLLDDHVSKLSEVEYHSAAGQCLFFRSVHGTLVHLALADRLWLTRLTTGGSTGSEHLWSDAATARDTESFIPEREGAAQAIRTAARDLEHFLARATPEDIAQTFTYHNTRGEQLTALKSLICMHVFNHATHHRGQISSALVQLGHPAPSLDLLYMLNPKA